MTTNPFITHLRASGSHETYFLHREMRRYEVGGKRFREAGLLAYADQFDGYAEQTRLEIEALAKVDQRMADLDDEITRSAIDFGGPLPVRADCNPFANAEFAPLREDRKVRS
jgi:hypothetical protein